jgi:zinc protease
MLMRIGMTWTLMLLCLGGEAGSATAAGLEAEVFELANGMKVVLIPDHRVPVLTHMLWYRVGSADEEPGKSGLAHFFEHLMFKGTRANPGDTYSRAIGRVGGTLNAFTSYDYTAYYATVGSHHLERVLELEADRMVNLDLSEEHVRVERDVVIEERRLRIDNNPEALLQEQVMAVLFINHRYGVPVIGWMHEIKGWTRDDVLAFYQRWYAPNNAILVVAGDVTRDRLKSLAERYYGPLKSKPITRKRTAVPDPIAERRVVMVDSRIGHPLWVRFYLAPAYGTSDRSRTAAVRVLAEILGGGPASVLYRRLVHDLGLATQVSVEYSPAALDPTPFALVAVPTSKVDLPTLERAIDSEIGTLRKDGIQKADLHRAQQTLRAEVLRARDGTYRSALVAGMALASGATLEEFEAWPDRIGAVTLDQVRDEVRAILRPEASATGFLVARKE